VGQGVEPVLFLIDVASRKVQIAGLTRSPDGLWMEQIARNLLDVEDRFLLGKKYLLLDRDRSTPPTFEMRSSGVGCRWCVCPREART
jgi:putative transposase